MKRILLLSPWRNVWVDYMEKYFSQKYLFKYSNKPNFHEVANSDIVISGWADGYSRALGAYPKMAGTYIAYIRSFEYYTRMYRKINWDSFDHILVLNDYIYKTLKNRLPVKLTSNAIDIDKYVFSNKAPNKDILFLAQVNHKKGIPLLVQLMYRLPSYTFHIVGDHPEPRFIEYIQNAKCTNYRLHGYQKDLQKFFDTCSYVVCTSPAEGSPNGLIEAMSAGLKPVIHRYLGYTGQFPEDLCWTQLFEAENIILSEEYNPARYRKWVLDKYDYNNVYRELEQICNLSPETKKESP